MAGSNFTLDISTAAMEGGRYRMSLATHLEASFFLRLDMSPCLTFSKSSMILFRSRSSKSLLFYSKEICSPRCFANSISRRRGLSMVVMSFIRSLIRCLSSFSCLYFYSICHSRSLISSMTSSSRCLSASRSAASRSSSLRLSRSIADILVCSIS